MAEFQYNNYIYTTTQQYLFLLDTSHSPRIGFGPHKQESRLENIMNFTTWMKFSHM